MTFIIYTRSRFGKISAFLSADPRATTPFVRLGWDDVVAILPIPKVTTIAHPEAYVAPN